VAQELSQQVKAYVGVSVTVNVGRPGSIERSLGKARRVIDKRNLHAR
jgi:phenylacetate-CoA ligase